MTAMSEKEAAHMPATASVPPRLWMKNGNVERLMMWFVNTQRFTRMIRTRSRVQSLIPGLACADCPMAAVLLSDMRRPFDDDRDERPPEGKRHRATSLQAAERINRTYAQGSSLTGEVYPPEADWRGTTRSFHGTE